VIEEGNQTMRMIDLTNITLMMTVAAGLTGSHLLAQQPLAAKPDLTPDSFPNLHALIRPHDQEWRHLKVEWLTDVVAARKKAAADDKPIVICYTGGAGYNEPLGTC
jgi:hypothetical protein